MAIFVAGAASPLALNGGAEATVREPVEDVVYGAYDPEETLEDAPKSSVEHIFIFWNHIDVQLLRSGLKKAEKNKRTLLVTVEPFTKAANWRDGAEELFSEIVSGRYDPEIFGICNGVARSDVAVWLRWGHEMDDGQGGRYPWAGQVDNANGYVEAYRYFVEHCKRLAPKAKYIWSPTGLREAGQYYPGDRYVDLVGISLYSLEAWDLDNLGQWSSPKKTLQGRYDRVAEFGKPIVLAEVGVAGSSVYVNEWLRGLVQEASSLPLIKAIVYFNARETGIWERYGKPDWRLSNALWRQVSNPASR